MWKFLLLVLILLLEVPLRGSWSTIYLQRVSAEQQLVDPWTQETAAFNQLLFSWNAVRPESGYFSFSVQVKDHKTQKWYPWHEMARWGRAPDGSLLQKSLSSSHWLGTNFNYVRLELPYGKFADAFRIRVTAVSGASLADVKQLAVNTVDLSQFKPESVASLASLSTVYISNVPRYSQMVLQHPRYAGLCSPTALTMLLGYLLKKPLNPTDVAEGVYDTGLSVYGSWPFNIAHAFERTEGKYFFHVQRLASFESLYQFLLKKKPVIVSIRGPIKGGATGYIHGHLLIVVGYNKRFKKVLCQDPAFATNEQTAVAYDLSDFLRAWERSQRLAYVLSY